MTDSAIFQRFDDLESKMDEQHRDYLETLSKVITPLETLIEMIGKIDALIRKEPEGDLSQILRSILAFLQGQKDAIDALPAAIIKAAEPLLLVNGMAIPVLPVS